MYNKFVIVGNLTVDPEMRGSGDSQVCILNVAVNRTFKRDGDADADFFKVVAFGKTAQNAHAYLSKGKRVLVEGRVERNKYTDKDGNKRESTEVKAEKILFLSPADAPSKAKDPETDFFEGVDVGTENREPVENPFDDELPF